MIKKLKISLLSIVVVALMFFMGASVTNAQAITYSANTTVDLSSPDINLTIQSGSTATTVVVNAGTVVATVPISGTFTITSADRSFDFTGQSQFGVITHTCNSSLVATLKITATASSAETITITPGSSQCVPPSGGGGGGGGGYVAPATTTPAVTTTPATTTPAATTTPTTTTTTTSATTYNFGTTTLKNGSRGEAVKELQRFLNADLNLGLVVDGALGPKTITVIKTWQASKGLVVDGLVGPATKAMMNAQ